jgi:anti-sigma-K factor RskA
MNGMPHDRARLSPQAWEVLEETLVAYALGALSDAELADVRRHLALCPACRAEVGELTAAVTLLPLAVEPVEPTPELRGRILAAARAAPAAEPPLRIVPAAPSVGPQPVARRPSVWRPWLLTAAAALLAVGVGFSNVVLRQDLQERERQLAVFESASRTLALAGPAEQQGARGVLVERAGGGTPVLLLEGMPAPEGNRTYQVWVIRGGQPVSAGVLPPRAAGQQRLELTQSLTGVQTVAVSVEPAGGSPSPTGPIVLATNL